MTYGWAGFVIDSDVPLPELLRAEAGSERVRIREGVACRRGRMRWHHHWHLPDGGRWLSIAKVDGGHLLRFRSYADFLVSPRFDAVRCEPSRTAAPETVRHLLLDQVLPALAAARGRTVVHACAVSTGAGGIGFIGTAGQGKSTLAAFFSSEGDALVTDDCLLLDVAPGRVVATPSYPSIRLSPRVTSRLLPDAGAPRGGVAQYSRKVRVGLGASRPPAFSSAPVRMRALYLLRELGGHASARIDWLSPRDAYLALFRHSFRLDPFDRPGLRDEVSRLAAIAATVPVKRLSVPRRLAALQSVRDLVLQDLGMS